MAYREGDLRISDANRLFHEIDAQCLNVVLTGKISLERNKVYENSLEATLYVFHHQRCLSDLRISDHADFQYHTTFQYCAPNI